MKLPKLNLKLLGREDSQENKIMLHFLPVKSFFTTFFRQSEGIDLIQQGRQIHSYLFFFIGRFDPTETNRVSGLIVSRSYFP